MGSIPVLFGGTGGHADSLAINISVAVPEPSTSLMLGLGLAGTAGYARHRTERRPTSA